MNFTVCRYYVDGNWLNLQSGFTESSRAFFLAFCCSGGRRDGLEREERGSVEQETECFSGHTTIHNLKVLGKRSMHFNIFICYVLSLLYRDIVIRYFQKQFV